MGKILLCDDSMFMRMLEAKMLRSNGHEIVGEASNGWEAISLYQLCQPELVLMDITMPKLDGISAVKTIMAKDPQAHIVMVSAIGQQSYMVEALDAGACDFVVKPFEREIFLEIIERSLGR